MPAILCPTGAPRDILTQHLVLSLGHIGKICNLTIYTNIHTNKLFRKWIACIFHHDFRLNDQSVERRGNDASFSSEDSLQ